VLNDHTESYCHNEPDNDLFAESIVTTESLSGLFSIDPSEVLRVTRKYSMRINPYFLSLIKKADDPLGKQVIPDIAELDQEIFLTPDPLWEEPQSPVLNLIHRYPDRVVFMVSNQCAIYCRHCMRKRRVGQGKQVSESAISQGIAYIRSTPAVRDVILSGGDPLMLGNEQLEKILSQIRQIPHVEIIRIHTRIPCVLPQRVDTTLAAMLKQFHPLYMNIQFNHPDEITPQSTAACAALADAGIPLGSQTVLLKGVNDDPTVMMNLMQRLLKIRVRPYYLHHADAVEGTRHFRTSIETGLNIMSHLRGRLSGIGVPQYMIDLPGGGGKIPLLPEYVLEEGPRELKVRNFEGQVFTYPLK
jgi:lysine 2,3-aminomutase